MLKSLFPWKHHKTKVMAAQQTMDDGLPDVSVTSQVLQPCHVCGRTFLPAPLRKHERICEKTSTKKRKPFDSLKQRVEGTDLADFHQKSYLKKPEVASTPEVKKKTRNNWKEKHLALVSAIRAAKGVPIPAEVSNALPKTKSTTALMAGTERCPSCDRQFGPKAYDRHVEWCREKKAQQRIHQSPANVQLAKERLEARTKYVPPLNRSKKTVVRDKYSSNASTETLASVKSLSPLSRGPSVRKPRPVINTTKGNEKANSNSDRRDKSKLEKSASGGGDKIRMPETPEKCVPVIGSPSRTEVLKTLQKKRTGLPLAKLNNVSVNNLIDGLTVASLVYDNASKKMVTWKDTIRKEPEETETLDSAKSCKVHNDRKQKILKSSDLEVFCKTTQSEKLRNVSKKIQCEKIVSCNDLLHRTQPKKIPLSKYSFKSKLNVEEVSDTCTALDREEATISEELEKKEENDVAHNAIEQENLNVTVEEIWKNNDLEIDSDLTTNTESKQDWKCEEENDSMDVAESLISTDCNTTHSEGNVLSTISDYNCSRNAHSEMSDWFENYMKKAESAECNEHVNEDSPKKNTKEEEHEKSQQENIVLLFKSSTSLDLRQDLLKTEAAEENCELDSVDLNHRRASHFSVKKSSSDVCVGRGQNDPSSKTTLVSLYLNKNREASDEEIVQIGVASKSLPNIRMNQQVYKDGPTEQEQETDDPISVTRTRIFQQKEHLRRKILEIAAREFVQECRAKENPPGAATSSSENSLLRFLEEEYTVPKKRRKIENKAVGTQAQDVFRFSVTQHLDLTTLKRLTDSTKTDVLEYRKAPDRQKSSYSEISSSETSSTLCDVYSPRIFALLDNILNAQRQAAEDRSLVVMTARDCRRLIDLDKEKLPDLQRRLKKLKRRQHRQRVDLKLPPIEPKRVAPSEDKEVQVEETLHLPRIVDRKLRRRDNFKKLDLGIKKDVGNVYFEYEGERGNYTYNPFESAQRQFMELLECDDFTTLTPTCTPVKQVKRPHTSDVTPVKNPSSTAAKKTVKSADPVLSKVSRAANRASVIEPPISFKDSMDSISDDFELMENLINDNFTDDNKNNTNGFFLHLKPQEPLTLGDILNNRKYSDDMSSIDPMLINENDNLSIPEHFRADDYSPTSTTDTDITIQNDVDHYSVQYDNKIAAIEPKFEKSSREKLPAKPKPEKKTVVKRSVSLVGRTKTDDRVSNKKLTNKSKLTSKSVSSVASTRTVTSERKGLSALKRSMTLFDPSPKPPPMKNKDDVDNYFSEKAATLQRNSPPKEYGDLLDETLKPEDLFNVDDEMYEEYKKYEEMYLKEKAQQSATKKHKPKLDINLGIHTASEEEEHSPQFNKISNDSAYGSLTRKTPKLRSRATKLTPLEQKQPDSTSSSGSENCPNSPACANQRLSKFCHECGNKYPLMTAKFCVECGVKRLVL